MLKLAVVFGLAANLAAFAGVLSGGWIVLLPVGNLALLGVAGWIVCNRSVLTACN